MSVYKDLKKAFGATVDMIAEKTSLQAQKSRLLTVMKNEEKTADRAYIALGKYLYSTMRDGMPEDVEQLCKIIDNAKANMTYAQELYREVIQKDEITTAQNASEVKDNFRKVREPIAAGAAGAAAKAGAFVKTTAKDTAAKAGSLKTAAAERAVDIKQKLQKETLEAAEDNTAASVNAPAEEPEKTFEEEAQQVQDTVSESTVEESYNDNSDLFVKMLLENTQTQEAAPAAPSIPVENATAEESAPTDSAFEMQSQPIEEALPTENDLPHKTGIPGSTLRRAQRLHDIIRKRDPENGAQQ